MKKFFLIILALVVFSGLSAQKVNKEIQVKASEIAKKLNLDKRSEQLVYNVYDHISKRMSDLPMGLKSYKRLLGYIDQEREDMMKVILSPSQYKTYTSMYDAEAKNRIADLNSKNEDHIRLNGYVEEKQPDSDMVIIEPEETPEEPAK